LLNIIVSTMTSSEINFLLSLSIVFTLIVGVIRYKKIDPSYYPFFYLALISFFVEILSYVLMKINESGIAGAVGNISNFCDFFFFTWLFHNWGLFNFKRSIFLYVSILYFVCWVVLIFFVTGITTYNKYFPVIYSLTLVLFAVTAFNKFVIQDRKALIKNPRLWISLGVVIAFSFFLLKSAVVLSMSLYGVQFSRDFRRSLQDIVVYSNLLVNLMYAIGALCLQKKQNFTRVF
jgi:hypothetical protein